jgi:hypothetical protein
MSRAPSIDWRTCRVQAAWYMVAYTVYSSMEILRIAAVGATLQQAAPVWITSQAICLALAFACGLALAAGAQWAHAAPRQLPWRAVVVVLGLALVQPQLNTALLRGAARLFLPSAVAALASNPFAIWRCIVGGSLFFGYCLLVQQSRGQQDQLARAELERAGTEVRLREARARALEYCIDPVLLERTIAALRTAYARDRVAGESLLDALVDFLRLAMPSVRAGATLDTDRATVRAWQRLNDQLEGLPPVPLPARKGEP